MTDDGAPRFVRVKLRGTMPEAAAELRPAINILEQFLNAKIAQEMAKFTLLQRAVIIRLRAAGYEQLASAALNAWRRGAGLRRDPAMDGITGKLRDDFVKANEQALQSDT